SYGIQSKGEIRLNIKISQQERANIIGTSREVVNRHLRALQGEGVLRMDGGFIVIAQPDNLEDHAHV
ncbi:MAG: winged helix-turn-helix domain-containing protein, partial [Alphaproteobacteria bacterium]|nr:winged helix-turn-helix domain-containing protein [Alphaproteobacteria bacterium]